MPVDKLENLLKLNSNGDLGDIVQRAQAMGELTAVVARALPEADRAAIVAANVREDGELVIICASSAWASRLRYESDLLLKAARDSGVQAHSCRVRVSQS